FSSFYMNAAPLPHDPPSLPHISVSLHVLSQSLPHILLPLHERCFSTSHFSLYFSIFPSTQKKKPGNRHAGLPFKLDINKQPPILCPSTDRTSPWLLHYRSCNQRL